MKTKVLLGLFVGMVSILALWDGFGGQKIARPWDQPTDIQYAFLHQEVPTPQTPRLRLTVTGRQSPIRFWDIDRTFELTVTYGGFIFEKDIDLAEGQDHYMAYVDKCTVLWTSNSVSFIEPSGAELRLPITMLQHRL